MNNVIDTAIDIGNFSTFVEAVKIAGLTNLLRGQRPFTVFAPQDGGFGSIEEGELKALLKNKDKLEEILKFHIVYGKYTISDLINIAEMKKEEKNKLTTLNGKDVTLFPTILCFCANDLETVKLETSTVIRPDISCTNGILHIMDKVLIL